MAVLLPLLGACASVMPQARHVGEQPAARALLEASAQAHGVAAFRQIRDLNVSYDGQPASNSEALAAAALVADAFRLFLLGPMHFLEDNTSLELAGTDDVEGRACDLLLAVRRPGHGLSAEDRYLLFIDRQDRVMRRVRFSMEGLASTQGAVVEVDFFDHRDIAGVHWPTRYFERIRKPVPLLPAHAWRLTGLDVNRGHAASAISGANFSGLASEPARLLK